MIRRWLFGAQGDRSNKLRCERKRRFCRPKLESLEDRRLLAIADDNGQLVVDPAQAPTSLIVQFKSGANFASSLSAYSYGSNLGESWDLVPDLREVHLNPGVNVQDALAAYSGDSNVVHAEPDYHVKLTDFSVPPSDEHYVEQWDLRNVGQQGGYIGSDIHMEDAWNAIQGQPLAPVVVAVIDTGVDYTHPDLASMMWTNPGEVDGTPGVDDDHDGFIDDIYGANFVSNNGDPMDDFFHGTHVAGTIAAVTDNGIGIAGIAPNVQIMALKFLNDEGSGVESDAIRALNYAVAHGAQISNNSWGGLPFSPAFQTALSSAAAKGHIFVAAAGNNGTNNDANPFYPASYTTKNVVSVAATDAGDALASFSNYGKTSVDIGAPGVSILSTVPMSGTPAMNLEGLIPGYGILDGTSMAAPHVTGVMALVWGMHPDWTMQQVIDDVLNTGDPVPSLTSLIKTGKRLDAAAALGVAPTDNIAPTFVLGEPGGMTKAPVDHVRIKFSEPIDPTTFDISDVISFTGPEGPLFSNGPFGPTYALNVTPVSDDNTTFDIDFDPVSTPGDYTFVLGPHMSDMAGNEVDQNGDRSSDDLDDFTFNFSILGSDSGGDDFSSTDTPLNFSISNPSVVTSYLTIDTEMSIADLNVSLNLTYPRDGNLNIWLVSPTGTSVMLSQRHGGTGQGFIDTVFDDQADSTIATGMAPFSGSFRPDEPLAAFNGENTVGIWQLNIQNMTTRSRQGTLNAWSLGLTPSGDVDNPPPPPPPQNDPPQPHDDFFTAYSGEPLTVSTATLLANDTDPNGDPLVVYSVSNPVGGDVSLNGDGTVTFTPTLDSLAPGSFRYSAFDGYAIATATVHITYQTFFDYHNYQNPPDVDNDGVITATDAITIINFINAHGGSTSVGGLHSAAAPKGFLDVIADNTIAANDVLAVVNYVHAHPLGTSVSTVDATGAAAAAQDVTLNPAAVDAYLLSTTLDSGLDAKKK
jgi:subtilisin family serine protease/subtilisin-like proprotein convertase family protein